MGEGSVAKQQHSPDMIEGFESGAERLAHWIGENAFLAGGLLFAVLAVAGGWGGLTSLQRSREAKASVALEQTRSDYLRDMGAAPGDFELPELANPATADRIREEYVEKFQAVADQNRGSVAGTLALFEVAEILDALGREEQVQTVWESALEASAGNDRLTGLLLQRVGESHERRESWSEAAEAHQAAGELEAYPLRYWALLDAARCMVAAGSKQQGLTLYRRVQQESPELPVPDHLRLQFRELEATSASS
jgi:tetratricopeptide (TPR) repeat protein